MDQDLIKLLAKKIKEANRIVFFGGAGVSTESGIPDFRSASGLYNTCLSAEEIISHSFFMEHPKEFYEFYKEHLMYLDAKPNDCHKALAELEKMGKRITIVTQNIDGLHQKAGSKHVFELHGSIHRNYCMSCNDEYDAEFIARSEGVPICFNCGSIIKPDVVLYEEPLDEDVLIGAVEAIQKADLLIIAGTSLIVQPAASLINFFREGDIFNINLDNSFYQEDFYMIQEKVGLVFKEVMKLLGDEL